MRMNKWLTAAAIMAVSASLAIAMPQEEGKGWGRHGGKRGLMSEKLAQKLNLTDAQKQQLRDLNTAFRQDNKAFFESARQTRQEVRAAKEAIGNSGVVLVGRAEGFLVGRERVDQVIKRLVAYSEAGADCLYAPGFKERDDIKAIVECVAPKPSNILIGGPIGLTMRDAAELGARRVSVGGAFARAGWGGFIRSAKELIERGTFDELKNAAPYNDLQELFRTN